MFQELDYNETSNTFEIINFEINKQNDEIIESIIQYCKDENISIIDIKIPISDNNSIENNEKVNKLIKKYKFNKLVTHDYNLYIRKKLLKKNEKLN